MKSAFKNFLKYRFLLVELVKKDIKLKYRRSYLGLFWTLLEPLLTMLVLYVVFSQLYGKSDRTFAVYILTGRLLYTFFSNATKGAMKSIRSNSGMIKKVYVPKYIYPLASVISNYVIFLLSLIVLIPVSLFVGVFPTKHIIQIVAPLFMIFIMALGVGMILATLAVFFRDLEYLWGVVLLLIMYCSAIFYEPSRVVKTGYGWIFHLNPLYSLISNFRSAVLYHQRMDFGAFWYATAFSVVCLAVGVFIFYKKQDDFILNI
ncbi:ABC transporter permease [Anaerolentibacter hominis]|uniref:ABC transporter permease n=1 Tax=Anaerolentibacter hominis TaxID=3079009 RepID=UPI0031B81373